MGVIKAVIFDMDGVLIDSEYLWRKAMIIGFNEYDMQVTEDECRKTMGMRFAEVARLWIDHFNKNNVSPAQLEDTVVSHLERLIHTEGKFIESIPEILEFCKQKKLKTGLATSSSNRLMRTVLNKLELNNKLDSTVSAEFMKYGKPHPEVFLTCAEELKTAPEECLVIEDSLNGVIAAKAARMQVIAIPDDSHTRVQQFILADFKFKRMNEVLALFKNLFQ
jgi:mannitol-1-/sugar-/sorbitol-6-/2-deoxyglucose-6-phosphatase